jgi:hypothetical protein
LQFFFLSIKGEPVQVDEERGHREERAKGAAHRPADRPQPEVVPALGGQKQGRHELLLLRVRFAATATAGTRQRALVERGVRNVEGVAANKKKYDEKINLFFLNIFQLNN